MEILKLNIDKTEPDAPSDDEVRFQVAFLASVAAVAASLIARFVFDAPLVPELLAHLIFAVAPIWVVEIAVGMLGPFAKHLAFLACVLLYLAAFTGAAMLFLAHLAGRGPEAIRRVSPLLFAAAFWLITLLLVIPLLGGGLAGRYLRQGELATSLALLSIHLVYGVALLFISSLYIGRPGVALANQHRIGRRRVLRGVGYAVVAVAVYDMGRSLWQAWLQSDSGKVSGGDGVFPNIDGLAREVTPTEDFYVVSKNPFDPLVDQQRWKIEVGGMVENPLALTYEDMLGMPAVEQYATLACIDNKVGGSLIGNALWRGVRLKELLERAGLKQGVVDIVFTASDDYRDSIPVARAMSEGALLAYEMNGEPLTASHGFPLRLIAPGIYGMKNVKWIKRIEALGFDFKGYWQARGWDDRAEYKTMSRIDVPDDPVGQTATVGGVAFAGDRGITKVEVSTDGGKTWEPAEIKPALSPFSWVLWHKRWTPARPGKYSIAVRATDGKAITQTSEYSPAAPDGTSGYHFKKVEAG